MMELEALQEAMPQITALGAVLAAVSPQREPFMKQMKRKHGLSFILLRDEGSALAKEFGLFYVLPPYLREIYKALGTDLSRYNGDDSWGLPMPARYVIGADAVILAAEVNPDYTRRPEPEETLEELKRQGKNK